MAEKVLVKIDYVDGTSEIVEAIEALDADETDQICAYKYLHNIELFAVYQGKYLMMIPREFVKSIRVIEGE